MVLTILKACPGCCVEQEKGDGSGIQSGTIASLKASGNHTEDVYTGEGRKTVKSRTCFGVRQGKTYVYWLSVNEMSSSQKLLLSGWWALVTKNVLLSVRSAQLRKKQKQKELILLTNFPLHLVNKLK